MPARQTPGDIASDLATKCVLIGFSDSEAEVLRALYGRLTGKVCDTRLGRRHNPEIDPAPGYNAVKTR